MNAPGLMHATMLKVGDQIASAQLNIVHGSHAQLWLISHNPLLSRFSPGKLHILFLGRMLFQEGFAQLDLTPGHDAYKERFANAWDHVQSLHVVPSAPRRKAVEAIGIIEDAVRGAMKRFDVTPAQAMAWTGKLRPLHPMNLFGLSRRRPRPRSETWVFPFGEKSTPEPAADARMSRDCLADLLAYRPAAGGLSRRDFTSAAMFRVEEGQRFYTFIEDDRLKHCAWLVHRPGRELFEGGLEIDWALESSALAVHVFKYLDARREDLSTIALAAMLSDARRVVGTNYFFVSIPSGCRAARTALARLGFIPARKLRVPDRPQVPGPAAKPKAAQRKGQRMQEVGGGQGR